MSDKDISTRQTESLGAQAAEEAANAFRDELAKTPQSNQTEAAKGTAETKTEEQKAKEQEARPEVPPNIPIPPPPRFPDPWCRSPFDPMCPQKPDPFPPDWPKVPSDNPKDTPKKPKS